MGICSKLNTIVTFVIILLASLWFILVAVVPHPNSQQNPHSHDSSTLPTIPLHNLAQHQEQLQLVQVIAERPTPPLQDQAALLVTCEWMGQDYVDLIQKIFLSFEPSHSHLPIYLVRQFSRRQFFSSTTLQTHSRTLRHLLTSCAQRQNIRKLTVIAYEEGALLSLLSLAESSPLLLARIDKVVLINPFHPQNKLYHNSALMLAQYIKESILFLPSKLQLFQQLRIVIVNTHRTVFPEQPQVRNHFHFVFQDSYGHDYQLNNTLALSSKAIHNIGIYIDRGEYFKKTEFVKAMAQLITLDANMRLSIKDIEYLLRYQERQGAGMGRMRREELGECRVLRLEMFKGGHQQLRSSCVRITIRQRHKYRSAALILYSKNKFELFSEQMHHLPISESDGYYRGQLTRLSAINQVVVWSREMGVRCVLTVLRQPLSHPFSYYLLGRKMGNMLRVSSISETVVVESCEGWRPVLGLGSRNKQPTKELIEWKEGNCYIQLEEYNVYGEWFGHNWQLVRNVIIFTCIVSHSLGMGTLTRFYTQLLANLVLITYFLHRPYLFENMVITSAATFIEMLVITIAKISENLSLCGQYACLVYFAPLFAELTYRQLQLSVPLAFTTSKLLLTQLLLVGKREGILVSIVKFYFMLDLFNTHQPILYPLFLLASWQMSLQPLFYFNTKLAQSKRTVANVLFLAILVFNLDRDGSTIHEIIDFYIIAHMLLCAAEFISQAISQQGSLSASINPQKQ